MIGMFAFLAVAAASAPPVHDAQKIDCNQANPLLAGVRCLSDAELSDMRGGFALPNGLDVSIAVQTMTSVDGSLLLRSVYRLDMGQPTFQVFAPQPGQTVAAPESQAVTSTSANSAQPNVSIMFDRYNGVSFIPTNTVNPTSVNVTTGGTIPADAATDSLSPLDLSSGPVQTAGGVVTLIALPAGQRAELVGDQLDISHIVGQAFGALVANSGNDRIIDTSTTISIDLRGATAANVGSTMLRVEDIALDAVRNALR